MFDPLKEIGKILIFFSVLLGLFGILLTFSGEIAKFLGNFRIGRLPGDILFKKDNFTFYFPIATSLLLSIILTILLNIILRAINKQ